MSEEFKRKLLREFFYFAVFSEIKNPSFLLNKNEEEILEVLEFLTSKKGEQLLPIYLKKINYKIEGRLEEIFTRLNREKLANLLYQDKAIFQLTQILNENQIPHVFLKGAETRNLYPSALNRYSNDIDLLVGKENFDAASRAIIENLDANFDLKGPVHDCFNLLDNSVRLELHKNLFLDELNSSFGGLFLDPISKATKEENSFKSHFSFAYNYCYLLGHSFKHLKSDGVYLSFLSDAYILKSHQNFSKDEAQKYLKISNLDKYDSLLFSTLEKYVSGEELNEDEYALEGLFIRENEETYIRMRKHEFKNRSAFIRSRLWLKRTDLATLYPIVEKKPVLIPFYQVKRWIHAIKVNKLGPSIKRITRFSKVSKTDQKSDSTIFSKIGL